MSQGIPQEGAPMIPPSEAEISQVEQGVTTIPEASFEEAPVARPVVYFPKEMPTDREEYKRVLESIYAQAGKIVEDRAHAHAVKASHDEFVISEEATRENLETLAQMNASGEKELGFFSRLGSWIRGDK